MKERRLRKTDMTGFVSASIGGVLTWFLILYFIFLIFYHNIKW